jgi:hypothetical protein
VRIAVKQYEFAVVMIAIGEWTRVGWWGPSGDDLMTVTRTITIDADGHVYYLLTTDE